jgi:Bacteriophage baseplate protein W
MSSLGFPYRFSATGRSRVPDAETRVRELVEMLIFTLPGERVMRPDLGTPVAGLIFEGLNDALAATLQVSIHAALQQWLGDILEVREVAVAAEDTTLAVDITYALAGEPQARHIEFRRDRA